MDYGLQLQKFLDGQPKKFNSSSSSSDTYAVVLELMWQGQYALACDKVASFIESSDSVDTIDENTPRLYRAWIECLAQLEDRDSLSAIANHLMEMGREFEELQQTFLALRGIISCELDQAPMSRMIMEALGRRVHSPYSLEFDQMMSRRSSVESSLPILMSTSIVSDYFTWKTLAADMAQDGHSDSLNQVLRHVENSFPGSPLKQEVSLQLAIGTCQWSAALSPARALFERFPKKSDSGFFLALTLYNLGQLIDAKATLNQLGELKKYDADLISLEARVNFKSLMMEDDQTSTKISFEDVRTSLIKAINVCNRVGLETDDLVGNLRELEQAFGGDTVTGQGSNVFRQPKNWLVLLSPTKAKEMVTSSDQSISSLRRAMGKNPAAGDIVLFVSKSAHVSKGPATSRQEWRLLSMYRVVSKPFWHPTSRWHTLLELIDRPEVPIPIDAQDAKSDINIRGKSKFLPKGHHARFGVYELDGSAMDLMINAVKRRSQGIDHSDSRRLSDSKKETAK